MDFITKLPISVETSTAKTYDSIFVVVDKLTKYTHFLPYNESFTTEELGYVFLDRIVRLHGLPKSIISDRDKLFTSAFWKTLIGTMGVKLKLSTAFHPTTDGQTERMNQTLEVYLRHYVNHAQDNWVSLLPMAQLALNNHYTDTTGTSPFYANFGKDPNLFMEPRPNPEANAAMVATTNLRDLHSACREGILIAQKKTSEYLRSKRKNAPQLKEGDKVYLLTKNLKTKRQTKKLDHVKVGPFMISEVRGPQNYRLKLPKDARIHPVFHISVLEPADPETPLQTTFDFQPEEDDIFEVEKIVERRNPGMFLVKWKGYPESENTWEPARNLVGCWKLVREFFSTPDEKTTAFKEGYDTPDISTKAKFH